jgi:putative membrane protein
MTDPITNRSDLAAEDSSRDASPVAAGARAVHGAPRAPPSEAARRRGGNPGRLINRATETPMRLGAVFAIVIGLALATAIAAWVGFGALFAALSRVGLRGLGVLCGYSVLPFCLLGSAWFTLAREEPPRRWPVFVWSRIVRDSAGDLLPFSHLGGFFIGARAAIERGVPAQSAYATTVVDVTTEMIAQLGFTGLGLGLLAMGLGAHSGQGALMGAGLVGLALTAVGAVAFVTLQRRAGGLAERLIGRFLPGAAARTSQVVGAIVDIYRHPGRIAIAAALHLAAWIASAAGVWLALRLSGVAIPLTAVLAVESLVGAVRSAAFIAPMGIGVQEASYALLAPLFGLSPELALAVSLLKRARDLVIGVPALLTWQGLEGLKLVNRASG